MTRSERKAIIYTSHHRSLYVGKLEPTLKRNNVASTLLVALDDDLEVLNVAEGQSLRTRSLLVPAGTDVEIKTHDSRIAQCFLDDLGRDLANIAPEMSSTRCLEQGQVVFSGLSREDQIIEQGNGLICEKPSISDAFSVFDSWIGNRDDNMRILSDERVAKAVSLIKDNVEKNIAVAEIAEQVNLSIPRLIQLFKQVTGTPIRRFRLWHRIFVTAHNLTKGLTLTEAAIAAGFTDYAQFSRVYRELCGASPSAARDNTEIRLLAA